ncbi:anaerobic ribonucleoside-triphosphate reductase [Campylobacter geochelonis]|uniref:Anaerobic ribonucleoside-triphosphate reductase n=2 Tax=Campylobacter geochelonis TaxID=1780362 RepID=A0A128EBE7_9BACT|nr:anaerobic ribonucleoside triphosphate reductase (N-terminal region) [Campylobacter geochelonis]CZE46314.1 anaerobic ribonucleoside-triphosphate reductase [Campylobacter geochelonis]
MNKEHKMNKEEILKANADKRTKCVVYTRVMGYHRPVESFNLGKKGEHKERVAFCEGSAKIKIA